MAVKINEQVLQDKVHRLGKCLELHCVPKELVPKVMDYFIRYLKGDTTDNGKDCITHVCWPIGWDKCRDNSLDETTSEFLMYLYCRAEARLKAPSSRGLFAYPQQYRGWVSCLEVADLNNPQDCEAILDHYRDDTGQELRLVDLQEYGHQAPGKESWEDKCNYFYPAYTAIRGKYNKYRRDLAILFDCGGKYTDLLGLRFKDYDLPDHLEIWQSEMYPQYPYSEEASVKQLIGYRYGLVKDNWCWSYPGLNEIAKDLEAPYSFVLEIMEELCEWHQAIEAQREYNRTRGIPLINKYR